MTDRHRPEDLAGADLEAWVGLATVLEWLPPALDAPLMQDFGLTHFEHGILFALFNAPEQTLRMSDLAGYANSSLSRLSRAVTRLQSRGLVQRAPDPKDRRSTRATLTGVGRELLKQATPTHATTVRRLVLDPLTGTQRRQLHNITARIQQAIRSEEGWRPPQAGQPPSTPE